MKTMLSEKTNWGKKNELAISFQRGIMETWSASFHFSSLFLGRNGWNFLLVSSWFYPRRSKVERHILYVYWILKSLPFHIRKCDPYVTRMLSASKKLWKGCETFHQMQKHISGYFPFSFDGKYFALTNSTKKRIYISDIQVVLHATN